MRLIAYFLTLVSLGAAAFAGQALWKATQISVPELTETQAARPAAPDTVLPVVSVPGDWPPLFGKQVIEEPQPPTPPEPVVEEEPQPPTPSAPPINSLSYVLQGVVSDGATRWAIISHPTGEALLRVGDALGDYHTVSKIDDQGLWATADEGATQELLEFAE